MRSISWCLFGLAILFVFPAAVAQDAPVRVVLVDGTVITGTVVDANADPVIVVTAEGIEQRVPQARIREITPLIRGRFTRTDPAATRLFVAPTARTLGQGRGRFSAYTILPSVAYGAADFLDVTAGLSIPAIGDGDVFLVGSAGVKAQPFRQGDAFAAALGTTIGFPILGGDGGGLIGTVYGVGTIGPSTGSLTFGAFGFFGGTEFSGDGIGFADGFGLLVAGDLQISNAVKLMTENHILIGSGISGLASLTGVRFFGDRITGDLGIPIFIGDGSVQVSPLPYVGFSYAFGR